ncbi:uncharacterized protein LOC112560328 isoform X2 [Pomacea canaliculata]|uniref:uncharacterized protein LOC112560328 isoform X2 n=1 Tax=Pomacea canaliculata TaxID=400727 RepID=UPI000D73E09C|nr:uncharacterized protein LOC112560328 isoform X2 [Pomacea canaliculata]
MSRPAMVLTAVIAGLLVWYPVYAKDDKCHTEYETTCVRKVSCSFHEKVIEERREFKIEYIGPGQKKEVIALCEWRNGQFSCDPDKGYTCDEQPSNNFSVLIDTAEKCLTDGEILFDVAYEQIIRCNLSNGIGSGDPKLVGYKRPESTNNLQSGQEGNGVTVGVSSAFGIVFLLVLVILVIFLCRRYQENTRNNPDIERGLRVNEKQWFLKLGSGK